jgi:1-acyl-sn-glycerol-3-phosphate acyltransferase
MDTQTDPDGVGGVPLDRFRAGLERTTWRQGRFERLLRGVIRAWCWAFGWRVVVRGLDQLPVGTGGAPGAGCVVAVAPHRAWIDPFLLLAAWPPGAARLAWMGDGATMTRSRWRRRLLPRLGMVPITPGSGDPRAYADLVAGVLVAGGALVIFPEKGPPSAPSATRTIAPGFAYLALRAGASVVPVVLGGTHRICRDVPFFVDVLAPLEPPPSPTGGPLEDPFTPAGRAVARALAERYAAAIGPVLRERTADADADRPPRERWRWLGTLFH